MMLLPALTTTLANQFIPTQQRYITDKQMVDAMEDQPTCFDSDSNRVASSLDDQDSVDDTIGIVFTAEFEVVVIGSFLLLQGLGSPTTNRLLDLRTSKARSDEDRSMKLENDIIVMARIDMTICYVNQFIELEWMELNVTINERMKS
jgi:hypothetical protein